MSRFIHTRRRGEFFERAAENHLVAQGFRIIARNFRSRCGEWDLIAEQVLSSGEVELVLVEVRARTQKNPWMEGFETIQKAKKARLERTARVFLSTYAGKASSVRMDVITCDGHTIQHLRDAWRPG